MLAAEIKRAIQDDGFAIIDEVLDEGTLAKLEVALRLVGESDSSLRRRETVFAVRNLLALVPEVAELAESQAIRQLVEPALGDNFLPVRGILFDKVRGANWRVPWHQDVTIAVQSRVESDGYGPWSTKAGVLHVQPPARVLENMVSLRLHLDPCGERNGALRVIPGSHRSGRITADAIPEFRDRFGEHVCALERGGALIMRPLLLHASSPSQNPGHRRVIHLDFASARLPNGMQWEAGCPRSLAFGDLGKHNF
jgi:ectoine hydroxylase-related dioxygenase (phytanoyl-CoA dioxygenase family)